MWSPSVILSCSENPYKSQFKIRYKRITAGGMRGLWLQMHGRVRWFNQLPRFSTENTSCFFGKVFSAVLVNFKTSTDGGLLSHWCSSKMLNILLSPLFFAPPPPTWTPRKHIVFTDGLFALLPAKSWEAWAVLLTCSECSQALTTLSGGLCTIRAHERPFHAYIQQGLQQFFKPFIQRKKQISYLVTSYHYQYF